MYGVCRIISFFDVFVKMLYPCLRAWVKRHTPGAFTALCVRTECQLVRLWNDCGNELLLNGADAVFKRLSLKLFPSLIYFSKLYPSVSIPREYPRVLVLSTIRRSVRRR